jgi:hypothetical protein
MPGWTAAGVYVETGTDESIEYRTVVVAFVWTQQQRTVTLDRAEWRGLTKAGAAAKTATSGWEIVSRELVGPSGQWMVKEEKLTQGAWT